MLLQWLVICHDVESTMMMHLEEDVLGMEEDVSSLPRAQDIDNDVVDLLPCNSFPFVLNLTHSR